MTLAHLENLERMSEIIDQRDKRIATLEARVKELEATVEHMDAICHTRERELAEANKRLFEQKDNRGDVGPQD